MDLAGEVNRLRLDVLAVDISGELTTQGIPHALLKGPSTATWLYDPPRHYVDVDILVPLSRISDSVRVLTDAGLAGATAGGVGEEAQHSLLMISTAGFEVDLHVSLPTIPPAGDRVWNELASHIEPLDLGIGTVPTLDHAGRCLLLALHALGGGGAGSKPFEDLRRARAVATEEDWQVAATIAQRLDAADLFFAGLAVVEPDGFSMSARAKLYATDAPRTALGLQRLVDASWRERPRLVWRELFPSRGFMRRAFPQHHGTLLWLPRAHLHRWWGIVQNLPSGIASWRATRR